MSQEAKMDAAPSQEDKPPTNWFNPTTIFMMGIFFMVTAYALFKIWKYIQNRRSTSEAESPPSGSGATLSSGDVPRPVVVPYGLIQAAKGVSEDLQRPVDRPQDPS